MEVFSYKLRFLTFLMRYKVWNGLVCTGVRISSAISYLVDLLTVIKRRSLRAGIAASKIAKENSTQVSCLAVIRTAGRGVPLIKFKLDIRRGSFNFKVATRK